MSSDSLRTDEILNDALDALVDGFRRRHPTLSDLELWQLIRSTKINGRSVPSDEVADALGRTR